MDIGTGIVKVMTFFYKFQQAIRKLPRGIIIISVAALVIILSLAMILSGGRGGVSSPNKVVDKYFSAAQKGDEQAVLKLMYDPVIECALTIGEYGKEQYLKNIDDNYSNYGKKIKSREATNIGEYDEDALESVNSILEMRFEMAEMDIYAAKDASLVTVRVEHEEGYGRIVKLLLMKFNSKWYLYAVLPNN